MSIHRLWTNLLILMLVVNLSKKLKGRKRYKGNSYMYWRQKNKLKWKGLINKIKNRVMGNKWRDRSFMNLWYNWDKDQNRRSKRVEISNSLFLFISIDLRNMNKNQLISNKISNQLKNFHRILRSGL